MANPNFAARGNSGLIQARVEDSLSNLYQASVFRGLSAEECTMIQAAGRVRVFARGDTIFVENDPLRWVSIVASGRVKTMRHSRAGKLVIFHVAGPGDVLDGLGSSAGSAHSITARAMADCRLLTWDVSSFESFAHRFPALQRNCTRLLVKRLHTLEGRFHELATERVPQRLAKVLLRLIVQARGSKQVLPINLSCEELAQLVGTTMFTVSRLLCDWAARGLIQPERSVVLAENVPWLIAVAMGEKDNPTCELEE